MYGNCLPPSLSPSTSARRHVYLPLCVAQQAQQEALAEEARRLAQQMRRLKNVAAKLSEREVRYFWPSRVS